MTGRRICAAQLRLGMRLSNGLEVVELLRPDKATVRAGYGRMWVGFSNGEGFAYYPSDYVTLAEDEDAPVDRTLDAVAWWPTTEQAAS